MNIELKDLKILSAKKDECAGFVADLYTDGVKFANFKDTGTGARPIILAYKGKEDLLHSAEEYCKSLPDSTFGSNPNDGGRPYSVAMDLCLFVSLLAEEELKAKILEKELEKAGKQAEKYMLNNVLFTSLPANEDYRKDYFMVGFGKPKKPIAELLSRPNGIASIKKLVAEELANGNRLVNTNIPAELLLL